MADDDKPAGQSVQPPTVPIKGVNVPDPTPAIDSRHRREADPVKDAEAKPDDPDKAAEDGLA